MIDPDTLIDGRYRVVSRIGSGGMADVYLAQDELLGRDVAVKVLHHHFAEDHEFVERFRREASSAAALSHPNIVGIFDRGEWNGTYYIAMEYVAGRSLKSIVRETGPLDPALAIDVVVQILRAAQFAHRRGVIHRDLKPHNVILDEDGRARVTDFGIARAGASDMTLTGSIMGTAQYLSPEQAQGYAVSSASDIYSVGVILYELLTGVVPFEGETAVAIAFKQVSATPRPPSEINLSLPAALDAVVLRALAKDPAERYADAAELIAALGVERAALPAYSGAAVLGAGHGAGGVGGAHAPPPTAGLLMAPLAPGVEQPDGRARGGRRRRRRLLWAALALVLVALAVAAALLIPASSRPTVPSVVGEGERAAMAKLRAAGLVPSSTVRASSTTTGIVIGQSPVAGATVKKGSVVTIVVSSGPASVKLQALEGVSARDALARLRKVGFKPTTKSESSSSVPAGEVISTDPPAGAELGYGSPVTVIVSSGPAPVRVPDVVGQSLAAAESTLSNAGLTVGPVTQHVSSSQPAGTVIAQAPARGSTLRAGEAVGLTVAKSSNEASVPSVVGKSEVLAAAALGQAGFTPSTHQQPTSESAQVGVVISQKPAAGRRARKGSTVVITVGVAAAPTTPTVPTTPASTTPTTASQTPGA